MCFPTLKTAIETGFTSLQMDHHYLIPDGSPYWNSILFSLLFSLLRTTYPETKQLKSEDLRILYAVYHNGPSLFECHFNAPQLTDCYDELYHNYLPQAGK